MPVAVTYLYLTTGRISAFLLSTPFIAMGFPTLPVGGRVSRGSQLVFLTQCFFHVPSGSFSEGCRSDTRLTFFPSKDFEGLLFSTSSFCSDLLDCRKW